MFGHTLDFDVSAKKAMAAVKRGRTAAYVRIFRIIAEEKNLFQISEQIRREMAPYLQGEEGARLRLALAERFDDTKSYRLWSCNGFDKFPDRGLILPSKGSMIEACLEREEPVLLDLETDDGLSEFRRVDRDGSLEACTPSDLCWSMAVPLPIKSEFICKSVALTLDGNMPLNDNRAGDSDYSNALRERLLAAVGNAVDQHWK